MTRYITPAMQAHINGPVTTLCTCWRAKLINGRVYGFTDHTRDFVFEGQLYKSSTGYTPTAVETSSMLNVDNLEVEAILNSPDISGKDLLAGLWDAAEIETFWVNYNDLSMGKIWDKEGTLGQLTLKGASFLAEVRGLSQAYTNTVCESCSITCRAVLGDARCKVDLVPFTGAGYVQSVGGENRHFADALRTEPGPEGGWAITGISRAKRAVVSAPGHALIDGADVTLTGIIGVIQTGANDPTGTFQSGSGYSINGYNFTVQDVVAGVSFSIPVDTRLTNANETLGPTPDAQYSAYDSGGVAIGYGNIGFFDYGLVTFTSGQNINLSMEVKRYVPGLIELSLPMPYPIAVGDSYTIIAGCGKRFTEDCVVKFNNAINFQGEPHLPGVDQITRVGGPPETVATGAADAVVGA